MCISDFRVQIYFRLFDFPIAARTERHDKRSAKFPAREAAADAAGHEAPGLNLLPSAPIFNGG
jgi:hypothetical protein